VSDAAAVSTPAAAASPSTNTADAAPAKDATPPGAPPAAGSDPTAGMSKAEKLKFKAKVEGKEEEVDIDTLLASDQKNKAADKRLQEVTEEKKALAEERRRAKEAKELGKKDPIRALREFFEAEDVDSTLEQYLAEKYKAELLKEKDPRAYEMAMKEKELAAKEAQYKKYEEEQQARAYQQFQQQQASEISTNYGKALQALGVSTDEEIAEAIEYMIDADLSALEYAATLPPEHQERAVLSAEQLAQYAKERMGGYVSKAEAKFFKDLDSIEDDDKFLEKLGSARTERVRKVLLKKAKAAKAQPTSAVPPRQKVSDDAPRKPREYVSEGDLLKKLMRG
jgi:hypothetical protein